MVLPIIVLHGGNDGSQRVTVIRIARQSGDMGHELAAFRAMSGRGDTDLYPEFVRPMRLALADALHFRRVQGIDLGSALTLILRQHAPGEAQRPGEDFFELGIAVDAPPDVTDDAAQSTTRAKSVGFIASVRVATDKLSWMSAVSFASPIRCRHRVSDERSNGSRCWKNSSPQKNWK